MRLTLGQCIFLYALKQELNKEKKMSKVTVRKKAQNELIKIMASKQKGKHKFDAPQLRNAADLVAESLPELSEPSKYAYYLAMLNKK